jgi:hypothetical protein
MPLPVALCVWRSVHQLYLIIRQYCHIRAFSWEGSDDFGIQHAGPPALWPHTRLLHSAFGAQCINCTSYFASTAINSCDQHGACATITLCPHSSTRMKHTSALLDSTFDAQRTNCTSNLNQYCHKFLRSARCVRSRNPVSTEPHTYSAYSCIVGFDVRHSAHQLYLIIRQYCHIRAFSWEGSDDFGIQHAGAHAVGAHACM